MPAKKKPAKAPAKLNKFWEEGPTLHDFFDGYPEPQRQQLAMHDYVHGSVELLSKLVMERGSSKELATFLSRIVRGEKFRKGKAGRPRGNAQDNPLTCFRIYPQIVCLEESGMSREQAYKQINR